MKVGVGAQDHPARQEPAIGTAPSVARKVDSSGDVCFAGYNYRVGNAYRRRQVQVAVVGDTVEIFVGQELIRAHPVSTTPPASTVRWPTPAADPTASTPPPPNQCQVGIKVSAGYRNLTIRAPLAARLAAVPSVLGRLSWRDRWRLVVL
ncbi:MAG: hypothetical protein ABR592_01545 [Nitriliruptorales bacterium]